MYGHERKTTGSGLTTQLGYWAGTIEATRLEQGSYPG
jgi:hypothetical protein